jgi:hypothetical protein
MRTYREACYIAKVAFVSLVTDYIQTKRCKENVFVARQQNESHSLNTVQTRECREGPNVEPTVTDEQ